jgi:hypothetical protein
MSNHGDTLSATIYDFFAAKVPDAAEGQAALHFDPLPMLIPASTFTTAGQYSAAKAQEFFSRRIADRGAYVRDGKRYTTVDLLSDVIHYDILNRARHYAQFNKSKSSIEQDRKEFEQQKAEAEHRLGSPLASVTGAQWYVASTATPEGWAHPATAWATYSQTITSGDQAGAPADSIVEPSGIRLNWHSLDLDALGEQFKKLKLPKTWPPPGVDFPEFKDRPAWLGPPAQKWKSLDLSAFGQGSLKYLGLGGAGDLGAAAPGGKMSTFLASPAEDLKHDGPLGGGGSVAPASEVVSGTLDADLLVKSSLASTGIGKTSEAKNRVDVTFKYQVIGIDRDWLFMPFLTSTNWYIEDARRGSLTVGDADGKGLLTFTATRAIAIKDLVIEAQFSAADADALSGAFAIGPFAVGDQATIQNGRLTIPEMQIIAYLDVPLPLLPPRTSPNLIV